MGRGPSSEGPRSLADGPGPRSRDRCLHDCTAGFENREVRANTGFAIEIYADDAPKSHSGGYTARP